MLAWYEILIISLVEAYFLFSIFLTCYLYHIIYRKISFLEKEAELEVEDKYKPFVRHDRKTMNIFLMFIVCFFFAPMRIFCIIGCLLSTYFVARLTVCGDNNHAEVEYNSCIRFFQKFTIRCS